jgi:pimeloyl-ACP methyl ester carboxylesterase
LQVAGLARTACITEVAAAMAGLTNADMLRDPATAVAQAKEVLAAQEIPVCPRPRPVVLFQGTADMAVPPPLTAITAAQLGAALVSVPGAGHFTLPAVVAGQVVTRVGQLFG